MTSFMRTLATGAAVAAMGVSLSGCIVAAVPLIMAAGAASVAATGFVVYKTVQTTNGGTVRIAFGSTDSKHALPPQPLPAGSVTVAAATQREQVLGERLQASGKFKVAPSEGAYLLAAPDDRARSYATICQRQRVNMVLAAVDDGQIVNSNMLSFKRGGLTHKLGLEAYGCAAHAVVWHDEMAVIIESGGKPTPQAEIDAAAGQAWADRLIQARALS
jgi:hypothetical protein